MWIGLYMAERTHEMLITGKPVGFFRLVAIVGKSAVELVLPAVSIIVYSMVNNSFLPEGPNCIGSEKGTFLKFRVNKNY